MVTLLNILRKIFKTMTCDDRTPYQIYGVCERVRVHVIAHVIARYSCEGL